MRDPLSGMPLRYLIGADDPGHGVVGSITEVGFDATRTVTHGISIKYCNLLDEKFDADTGAGNYGPYLKPSGTADDYGEGLIDPHGLGWRRNLVAQFGRAKAQGFAYIELDNPDSYDVNEDVIPAIELAATYGLKVIAKNANICDDPDAYMKHPNVYGCIVERDCGTVYDYESLRRDVGRPLLPVWFVFFGGGRHDASMYASNVSGHHNMGVTYSAHGEYQDCADLYSPVASPNN